MGKKGTSKNKAKNAKLSEDAIRRIEERAFDVVVHEMPERFFLVGVDFEKDFGHWHLRVYAEKQGEDTRISIEDCEQISLAIDEKLEALRELGDLSYNLEVSSPGLNRQLKTPREFAFYQGRPVRVEPAKGPSIAEGLLDGYEAETRTVLLRNNTDDVERVALDEEHRVVLNPEITMPE